MPWRGLDQLRRHVEDAPRRVRLGLSEELDEGADQILDEVRRVVPEKTGRFRRSWRKEDEGPLVRRVVTRGVPYDDLVDFDDSGVRRILSRLDASIEPRIDAVLEF